MVNWKKTTTLLEEKNLFSLLRIYEQVVFLSRFHNREVWSRPGIPPFPPPTPTKSRSPPPKITYSEKGTEHRTLTHHLCYEVLKT